ncbi:MAG: endolytic transglycosylase MltG [Oscillospiraceae bacterium]|nr:endolytic transglycosylase MltG [Oscillospiraceae bacterium]
MENKDNITPGENEEQRWKDEPVPGFYEIDLDVSGGERPPEPDAEPQPPRPQKPASPRRADSSRRETARRADNSRKDDFQISFDFDKEYRDVPDDRPLRPRREKRTGCLGGALFAVFVICVSLVLACLLWLAATDVLGFGAEDRVEQITIPKAYTIEQVADILSASELIKYEFLFKIYADISNAEENIAPGTYQLNANYDYHALVNGMTQRGGKRVEVDVVLPEGLTVAQMFARLAEANVCFEEDLWETASDYAFEYDFLADAPANGDPYRLEGFLFPDTYTFYVNDSPARVLKKMLDNFKAKFKQDYIDLAADAGYTVREIVTIAAMIEREAGTNEDRPLIASVIYNRLRNADYPHLEIDATYFYAAARMGEDASVSLDSPYNTYKIEGLPPGPIANPGIQSIKAALEPKTTSYYFYALTKEGNHAFFNDFQSQQDFVHSDEYGG